MVSYNSLGKLPLHLQMSALMLREFISWSKAAFHLRVHYNSEKCVTFPVYLGRMLHLTPLLCLQKVCTQVGLWSTKEIISIPFVGLLCEKNPFSL